MRRIVPEPEMSHAAHRIEACLAEQMSFTFSSSSPYGRTSLPILATQTPSERLAALRTILSRRPSLAAEIRHLSMLDQLRLTVELLGGAVACGPKTEGPTVARFSSVRETALRAVGAWPSIARCRTQTPGLARDRNSR